eukprot:CAMPEP_0184869238 /NCGR_PEP_ID=MMETSP0580-20130426/33464_1 /TAXON_ID=1118495 /ORGANISM="Dactyliosolen fragilissimus" /LENGTH=1429 /DNA_ID=CAMNT_0027370603 /DNA_START=37 /DNA_END=4323 /DNA_ORIENTATION=+
MEEVSLGDILLTNYGVVVVVNKNSRSANSSNVTNSVNTCDVNDDKIKAHGPNVEIEEVKETASGSTASTISDTSFFEARLWRESGKSIASSSIAYLRPNTIIKPLPAAPGMTTKWNPNMDQSQSKNVYVHSYSASDDMFTIQIIKDDNQDKEAQLNSNANYSVSNNESNDNALIGVFSFELSPSKSSKFYPLIHDLIKRGNDAATKANRTLKNNEKVKSLITKTMSAENTLVSGELPVDADDISKRVGEKVSSSLDNAIPKTEEVKEIYKMLKDEELTILLEKGQSRLRQILLGDMTQATKQTLQSMGIEVEESDSPFMATMTAAQEKALKALDHLLEDNLDVNIETIKETLGSQFETMFDSLSSAAKSDKTLNSIFEQISDKTSQWQDLTGRVLSTRSASLFFEGAQRLQARVGGMFTAKQLLMAQNSLAKLTKSFTEGDAALARLKSIEIGDSIRSRLVTAIELRSDSHGGLDGIIAGALSKLGKDDISSTAQNSVQSVIRTLQDTASNSTKTTQESLISMISSTSQYHDVAIMRIEKVFMDLESQLGDEFSAEQIVSIARGEGGTAALFEPIARKAAAEINRQLDAAESSVTDPTVLTVLSHVRKIISGDLTIEALVDEITNILNDEKIITASENIMKEGERILDVIEGASENQAFGNIIDVVEKAGLTRDAVIKGVTNLNVDSILDTAGGAVSDEKKRKELLSSATDSALDFLLRILPSMPIPPFDGVKDGLLYQISNLSMEGFKVKKDDIMVQVAGIRASKNAKKAESTTNSEDVSHNSYQDNSAFLPDEFGLPNIASDEWSSLHSVNSMSVEENYEDDIKATELLVIDVKNISAIFEKAEWGFEQTYMPYLKGDGIANAHLSNGHIRLQFELRKRSKDYQDGEINSWEPVLCLHKRQCSIGEISLKLEGGGRLTWILNKLASIFKSSLRDYVVRTIQNILTNKSGWLLEKLNSNLNSYWDIILKTAKLTMDDLAEATEDDIIAAAPDPHANEIDLVWREFLPLGMNLLMNDESQQIKVADFPRGSQARKIAIEKNLDPAVFIGATLIAVNGTYYDINEQNELFEELKDPERPKTIKFSLAEKEDSENVSAFVNKGKKNLITSSKILHKLPITDDRIITCVKVEKDGPLGITFTKSLDNRVLVVKDLSNNEETKVFNDGQIKIGDILTHINDEFLAGSGPDGIEKAFSCLEKVGSIRPLSLSFSKPYIEQITLKKDDDNLEVVGSPDEFGMEELKTEDGIKRIYISGFRNVDGVAETSGVILGDQLVFINGGPVGSGCKLFDNFSSVDIHGIRGMFKDPSNYPMSLTFARQSMHSRSGEFEIENAKLININVESFKDLGCIIGASSRIDEFVVKRFYSVEGFFQRNLKSQLKSEYHSGLAFESINGQVIPTYASCDMVMSAMKRCWSKDEKLEIVLCDDERKIW